MAGYANSANSCLDFTLAWLQENKYLFDDIIIYHKSYAFIFLWWVRQIMTFWILTCYLLVLTRGSLISNTLRLTRDDFPPCGHELPCVFVHISGLRRIFLLVSGERREAECDATHRWRGEVSIVVTQSVYLAFLCEVQSLIPMKEENEPWHLHLLPPPALRSENSKRLQRDRIKSSQTKQMRPTRNTSGFRAGCNPKAPEDAKSFKTNEDWDQELRNIGWKDVVIRNRWARLVKYHRKETIRRSGNFWLDNFM